MKFRITLLVLVAFELLTPNASRAELIILAAPTTGDPYYEDVADSIFRFHLNFARQIDNRDQVLVLTDAGSYDRYARALGRRNVAKASMLDIWMRDSDMDGLELLEWSKSIYPDLPILMISGHGNIETAVQAIRNGAYDFIEKPFDLETFRNTVSRALEKRKYVIELRNLQAIVLNGKKQNEIIGESKITQDLREYIKNIANSFADVLILGETVMNYCLEEQQLILKK